MKISFGIKHEVTKIFEGELLAVFPKHLIDFVFFTNHSFSSIHLFFPLANSSSFSYMFLFFDKNHSFFPISLFDFTF